MHTRKSLMTIAAQYCDDKKLRLTPPRLHVLSILSKANEPMGAYDILDKLGQHIERPKPPTAYRAIDFWRSHGFIHKIESLNSYMTCCEDHSHKNVHFLVCDGCQGVQEVHLHDQKEDVLPTGFVAKKTVTETHGTCKTCVDLAA